MLVALLLFSQSPLDAALDDPRLAGSLISAYVCDRDGREIYARNASLRVMPASNQKLLTGAFALHTLGPRAQAATRFWREPEGISIEANGDPLLTYDQLKSAQKALGNPEGDVYLRESYRIGIPPDWELDDLPNKYAAPVTAFSFDRASYTLARRKGRLRLEPESFGTRIRTERGARTEVQYDPFRREVRVTQGPEERKDGIVDTLALPDPAAAAASLFGRRTRRITEAPNREPDHVIPGATVIDSLRAGMPPSDNNIAERLLLWSTLSQGAEPTYPEAARRLTRFLTDTVGIDPKDLRVRDGSGLSRHNLVTTRGLARLMRWSLDQPTSDLWRSCLVRPGSGTLSTRLQGLEFLGKTGSLDMVAALTGTMRTKDGRELVISLVFNHFLCEPAEARRIMDQFLRAL